MSRPDGSWFEGGLTGLFPSRVPHICFRYPTDLAVLETNLYSPRMKGRRCQDILDDPICQFSRALVLFKYDGYLQSGVDLVSVLSVQFLLILPGLEQHP